VSRSRYRSSSKGYSRSRAYRLQRALAHIAAAKRLTAELGGMDQAVKAYFFSLPSSELAAILDEYERKYRSSAREYAADTFPKWRAGRVQMSGVVAERLFNLLPPRMPLAVKYRLVEGLWHHVGPSSKYRLRVGPEADVAQVVEFARSKISEFVVKYKIPADLERRFNWLAAGDVTVKQLLLSHIQEIEKTVAVEAVRAQLPVMLEHLRSAGPHTGRLAQIVHVGKHELEIIMAQTAAEINNDNKPQIILSTSENYDKALVLIIIILSFIIAFFWICGLPIVESFE
jgi:hypothetical protein